MSLFKRKSESAPKTTEVTCKNLNGNSDCDLIQQIKELKAANEQMKSLLEDKKYNNNEASKYVVWTIAKSYQYIRGNGLSDINSYIRELFEQVVFPPSKKEYIYKTTSFLAIDNIVCKFIDSFKSDKEFEMFINALKALFDDRKFVNEMNIKATENTRKINELKEELGI